MVCGYRTTGNKYSMTYDSLERVVREVNRNLLKVTHGLFKKCLMSAIVINCVFNSVLYVGGNCLYTYFMKLLLILQLQNSLFSGL